MATEPKILLDITRSLRRLRHSRPSGIDRVERAYIEWTLDKDACFFAMLGSTPFLLDHSGADALLRLLDGGEHPLDARAFLRPDRNRRVRMGEALVRKAAIGQGLHAVKESSDRVYLNTGHVNLSREVFALMKESHRVVMIHDLIPLEFPQYARRNGPAQMLERLQVACAADHIVTNSTETAKRVQTEAEARQFSLPPVAAIPLGVSCQTVPAAAHRETHFVCLGTIEPRKNHALLLDIWKPDWPKLYIVGRRGWENREVFRRLDRSLPNIIELNDVSDHEIVGLIGNARALLFPSFVEGYGLPLAEALALGTPVIASDLPALREVGADVPEYLAASDPDGWSGMILSYIDEGPAHTAQLKRLESWSPPTWSGHFAKVDILLSELVHNRVR
ncbi:MAG: glycosyltransferase family 1 protein [Pseudomonadota bacterium]